MNKVLITGATGIDNTVSIIDVVSQKVTGTIPVVKSPNDISYWFETGGTT